MQQISESNGTPDGSAAALTFTLFPNPKAKTAKEVQADWEHIAARVHTPRRYPSKEAMPLVKLGRFGRRRTPAGCLRSDDNMLAISGIEGDYDGEKMPLAEAVERLGDACITSVVYSTPSSTPERPRWRVLAPLSHEYPPSERARFVAQLNGVLGGVLAAESFAASQTFYIGAVDGRDYSGQRVRGQFIDLLPQLDAGAIYKAPPPPAGDSTTTTTPAGKLKDGRKKMLHRLAAHLRGNGAGVPEIAAVLAVANQQRCDPPLGEVELHKVAHWIESKPAGAAQTHEWPDPSPLPSELLPVPAFTETLLPVALRPWLADAAERMQCPPEYLALGAIVSASSLVGRRVVIRPQRYTDWSEAGNAWGLAIGRPGTMKSPGLHEATRFVRQYEAQAITAGDALRLQYKLDLEQYETTRAAARKAQAKGSATTMPTPPPEPQIERFVLNDATIEALHQACSDNPGGLLVLRDEVPGLLRQLDSEEFAYARSLYLEAWGGQGTFTMDRIIRGTVSATVNISMLGGAQPGRISSFVKDAVTGAVGDDGLLQRMGLVVWPDTFADWREVDRQPDTRGRSMAAAAFAKLRHMTPPAIGAQMDPHDPDAPQFLRFEPTAAEAFSAFLADLMVTIRDPDLHPALAAHLSKYRKLVPSLALVFHLINGGTGPVSVDAALLAIAWAEFLRPHAERLYGSGVQVDVQAARAIWRRVKSGAIPPEFDARAIYRNHWAGLDREGTHAGLKLLADLDWIAARVDESTGGRPSTRYLVNPKAVR